MELGLRVVRGPDWKWGQQDGGVGHVGTVVEIGHYNSSSIPHKTVVVQWDSGSRSNYRVGYQGAYDLRVFDNAPAGAYHPRVRCDECGSEGIIGMRWQCSTCIDFDLCTPCYMKGAHDLTHPFVRIDTIYHLGLEMPKRSHNCSVKNLARGIFKGAKVVRGHDWEWDSQDGGEGKIGEVIDIRGWDKASGRSVASVRWQRSSNVYRVGHKGKVDLKCVSVAPGYNYYRDHLPILGQNFVVSGPPESLAGAVATSRPQLPTLSQQQSSLSSSSSSSTEAMARSCPLNIGDKVLVVAKSSDELRSLQKLHGGWNPKMSQYINQVGTVHRITESRDIRVQFENSRIRWTFNPEALEKYVVHEVGDTVRIIDDEEKLIALQHKHGEYVMDMRNHLGATGIVTKIYCDGDLRVSFKGKTWTFNPRCCINLTEPQRKQGEGKCIFNSWTDWIDELEYLNDGSRDNLSSNSNATVKTPVNSTTEKKSTDGDSTANTSSTSNSSRITNINHLNPTSSRSSLSSANESTSNLSNGKSNLESINSTDVRCLICDENFANIRFYPCDHQVCCSDCNDCIFRMKKCISCKQLIKKLVYIDPQLGFVCAMVDHTTKAPSTSSSSSNMYFEPSSSTPSSASTSSSIQINNNLNSIKSESKINTSFGSDAPLQRLRYLESKISEFEEANTCGICLESIKNVIFLCGHGCCADCSSTLSTCHMCRKTITKKINVY